MKRALFLAGILFLAAACVKADDVVAPQPDNELENVDIENINTTSELIVPHVEGKVAVVYNADGAQIARCAVEATILVAKGDQVDIQYVDATEEDLDNVVKSNLWQVIAFEDSVSGDYDYNDFVFHVRYEIQGSQFALGIQPIALGSTKKIALGCDIWQNGDYLKKDIIIASDIREKFFEGSGKRMINTYGLDKDYCVFDYKPCFRSNMINLDNPTSPVYVNWFIEVDGGRRLYAVSTKRTTEMIDKNSRPYGLVMSDTGLSFTQEGITGSVGKDWINYPLESVSIDQVYPDFGKWLRGEETGTFQSMYVPDAEGAYDAIGNGLYIVPFDMTSCWGKPSKHEHVIPLNRTQEEIDGMNFDY